MKDNLMEQKNTNSGSVIVMAIAALLSCGISANTYAASDSATIIIIGRVLANTCTIDTASAEQNITLDDIADRDIKGKGTTGGEKAVSIILRDCGASASSVVVTASGVGQDIDDTTAFVNSAVNGAEGVGLYFWQTDGTTRFLPDGSVKETSVLIPSVDNTLTYKAAYVGTKDTIKAGAFSTVVYMTFDYQ